MSAVELNAILGRGICFSKIEKAHRILVTGMSPSFRQGDPAQENFVCEYEYQGIVEGGEDRYFLAFDKLFPEAYKREVAYRLSIPARQEQTLKYACAVQTPLTATNRCM